MTSSSRRRIHLPIDPFLMWLMAAVALAVILPARGEAADFVDTAVTAAVALLFLLYGARLSPAAVKQGLLHWRLQAMVFSGTFMVFPLIGIAASLVLRPYLPADLVTGILFMSLLPSTVQSSIAFTSIARGNVPAALCSASLSNLVGVVLTPVLVSLLLSSAGAGVSLAAFEKIAAQIVAPFVVGQLIRPWVQAWLLRHGRVTAVVDRGSVLMIVYAAFSAGMVAGIWGQLSVGTLAALFAVDLSVLALVIATTTLASRWTGFSTEDEIAIVFCGSKKSMSAGISMAAILFPGHALGLIVLPLMLFHQIQLFVCAALARRYANRRDEDRIAGEAMQSA